MTDLTRDTHIRRSGEDYATAFLELLPTGQAWPRHALNSIFVRTVYGLCDYWGTVDGRAADLLEIESDPRTTLELLPDWERNWGLPDPCFVRPQTIDERHAALVQRITIEGGQSRQFFIDAAASVGYYVTISEYRPFMVGLDRCGDDYYYGDGTLMRDPWNRVILNELGTPVQPNERSESVSYGLAQPEIRYYWTVHIYGAELTWFRCGEHQCGIDPHLRIEFAVNAECLLRRWKPAHTEVIFDYAPRRGNEGALNAQSATLSAVVTIGSVAHGALVASAATIDGSSSVIDPVIGTGHLGASSASISGSGAVVTTNRSVGVVTTTFLDSMMVGPVVRS
jgi:uncharacterized protein YmfQ (DUF2313 family)